MIRKVEGTQFDYEIIQDKCPLPRIGSKEWGWAKVSEDSHREFSDLAKYYVCISVVYDNFGRFAASSRSNAEAKRIAELLARRDWRREMRGKK